MTNKELIEQLQEGIRTLLKDNASHLATDPNWMAHWDSLLSAPAEPTATPSSRWAAEGQPDPHGTVYDCERAALALGDLTDDELANIAFLNYDHRPSIADLIAGKAHMPISYMTAVKERIRWLSRRLTAALAAKEKDNA